VPGFRVRVLRLKTKYLALADKAARTVALLSEGLARHRGKGQQQITVKHVTVNADQAVVADTVIGGSKASAEALNENDGRKASSFLETPPSSEFRKTTRGPN
jgi:hypothetical protein